MPATKTASRSSTKVSLTKNGHLVRPWVDPKGLCRTDSESAGINTLLVAGYSDPTDIATMLSDRKMVRTARVRDHIAYLVARGALPESGSGKLASEYKAAGPWSPKGMVERGHVVTHRETSLSGCTATLAVAVAALDKAKGPRKATAAKAVKAAELALANARKLADERKAATVPVAVVVPAKASKANRAKRVAARKASKASK